MTKSNATGSEPLRVIAYVRVSTEEQKRSGAGLAAQRRQIQNACRERGWTLLRIEADEAASGKSTKNRPALARALRALEAGDAEGLIVAKLDRLSRSVRDFVELLDRSQRQRWALVCLDLGLDTSTPTGRFVSTVIASVSQLERELIGQRTREALAEKRAEGVILGRPRSMSAEVADRIRGMRDDGMTFTEIAATLNAEGVPTPRAGTRHAGREWWPSTIQRALRR